MSAKKTVGGAPAIEYPLCRCLSCVTGLLLVEQGNIDRPTSYYDGPWTLPTSKMVVLWVDVFPVIRGLIS